MVGGLGGAGMDRGALKPTVPGSNPSDGPTLAQMVEALNGALDRANDVVDELIHGGVSEKEPEPRRFGLRGDVEIALRESERLVVRLDQLHRSTGGPIG